MGRLIEIGRREGLKRIFAVILAENPAMLALAKHFHFAIGSGEERRSLTATLELT
jgi:RimJ/RimL family protein N-acetyltransferase